MLTYLLDKESVSPLYEQLYLCIKNDILAGRIEQSSHLPSKRSLARHLEVSVVTVESAYAQLVAEGYVYSKERSGYYVSAVDIMRSSLPLPLSEIPQSVIKTCKEERTLLHLGEAGIPHDRFPFSVWSHITRTVLATQDKQLLEQVPYNGIYDLRKAIADHLFRFRGLNVDPDRIIIGAGTEYLQGLIIQLLGQNNIFAVEDPGYTKIKKIYDANKVICLPIPMDDEGISVEALRSSGANIVHISPSHHFPTGIVMPIGRRQEMLFWASEKTDRYIIEDEYDSEFRFAGRPIPSMQSIDRDGRVIYINSFTKTIAPSIRISYMILPPSLHAAFKAKLGFYTCTVSAFEQHTLAQFISSGSFESHINRMKKYYREQRDRTIRLIERSALKDLSEIDEKSSGLHFLLKLQTDFSDVEVKKRALEQNVLLLFLSDYLHASSGGLSHRVIVNYAKIDEDSFSKAASILADIIKDRL